MLENGENELVKTITTEALLIRLGLMTPVIFSLVYCLGQYGHERRFHEQYAFKAVSMLSIESSIQLLGRSLSNVSDIGDRDNKITTFALHTLELIYKDPVETNKKSLLFRGGNNLLELSAEMSESFGEIKEIKSGIEKLVENNEKGKT